MGQASQQDNSQLFKGMGIALVAVGVGYYFLNGQEAPAPGPIQGVANNEVVASPEASNNAVIPPSGGTAESDQFKHRVQPTGINNGPVTSNTRVNTADNDPSQMAVNPAAVAAETEGEMENSTEVEIPDTELKLPELIARVEPAVVRINTRSSDGYSIGSGYVVSAEGLIATNYHVIEGAKEATVEFVDGTRIDVTGFRHYDTELDIAILQIDVPEEGLTVLPLADELPQKGASVVAFGAPHGLSFSTTEGIISAIREQEEMQNQLQLTLKGTWLQTSTPISPGNSGGPLMDLFGRVVAMNTMQLATGQNLNFAVSAVDVQAMVTEAGDKPLQELSPDKLETMDREVKRQLARNIEDTDRGRELLAKTDEIWLVLIYEQSSFDPTGRVREMIYAHAETAVKRSGVNLSFGEPSGDASVMIVRLDMEYARGGAAGTQEVFVDAFLICEDPEQTTANKLVKIWTAEKSKVGSVAPQAVARGMVPQSMNSTLQRFFNKFRAAHARAGRE